jgi:hypothetical protein
MLDTILSKRFQHKRSGVRKIGGIPLHPDAVGLLYNEAAPAGHSQIAALIDQARTARAANESAVLCALQQAHWQIHAGFCQYQSASEQRRQLAADLGELISEFVRALTQAGWTEDEAHNADVHQLAASAERSGR